MHFPNSIYSGDFIVYMATCYCTSTTYNFQTIYYHGHIQILSCILVTRKLFLTMATGQYSHLPLLQVEGWCRGERL